MLNELISRFEVATGWTAERIKEELSKLKCNYWVALDVFLAIGSLPDGKEQAILNIHGFEAWLSFWERSRINNLLNH